MSGAKLALVVDVNAAGWKPGIQVIVDGKDVSKDCWRAELYEDGTVLAYCYSRAEKGQFFCMPGMNEAAKCELRGMGSIVLP